MRAKRHKSNKKLMHAYSLTFSFREPYQVLLDASIIQEAAKCKMRLGSLLQGTLQGEIKPMITQCCIRHLYTAATTNDAEKRQKDEWIEVAKQAERRRCGHHELEEPLSGMECLRNVVDPKGSGGNKHRYVLATNEKDIRQTFRNEVAGVPLIYINRSVMILEPMGGKSEQVRESEEKGKIRAGLASRRPTGAGGEKRKRDDSDENDEDIPDRARAIAAVEGNGTMPKKRKVKGPKGPNPLSVRKAKKGDEKKAGGARVEGERAAVRKAARKDPQAASKIDGAESAVEQGATDGAAEGAKKRKRKRKPKDDNMAVTGAVEDDDG